MVRMQVATLAMVVVLGMLGCAPGPRPGLKRLYEGLKEPLEGIDVAGLNHRRIVIDPGHGGVFRGAIGPQGTEEAVVNLGVALHLAKLLEDAGAEVTLTRTADADFVGGDSLRLRDDLRARVDITNRIDPDLFISLHHNADPTGDCSVNEIQVYHRLSDEGPSVDIARAVARHLVVNLGEERNQVLPGNYYVLRNAVSPAVLGEPSFISNPGVEAELRLDEKRWLEAAAYFLAVADYFAGGVPRVARLGLAGKCRTAAGRAITGETRPLVEVEFDGDVLVDAATVEVVLDGVSLAATRVAFDRFVALAGGGLRGGMHTVRASGRSYGGNASRQAVLEFEVQAAPAAIALSAEPAALSAPYPRKITALVLDAGGNPAAESTGVEFAWQDGALTRPTRLGKASVFGGRDLPLGAREVKARCGTVEATIDLSAAADQTAGAAGDVALYVSGFVADTDGRPLGGALVATPAAGGAASSVTGLAASRAEAVTDEDGFFVMPCGAGHSAPTTIEVSRPGFRLAQATLEGAHFPEIKLERFYRSLRRDIVVVIDAQGGGEAAGWRGRGGVTAAGLSLAVAERLRAILASVGIAARLTRDADRTLTKVERLRQAEAAHPTLLVSIAHAAGRRRGAALGRFPTSAEGARLAAALRTELESALAFEAPVADDAQYLIQQTSCPAASVTFLAPRSAPEDASLAGAYGVWERAYAVACGILRYLGVDGRVSEVHAGASGDAGADLSPTPAFAVSGKVTRGGRPEPRAVVVLDGALEVPTDADGEFRLRLVEMGEHTVRALSESGASRTSAVAVGERTRPLSISLD